MLPGPELKRIYNLLLSKVNGIFDENRKFYVEAAHDCTLIALLKAMGNKNSELEVKTSAYLVFELHYLPNMYIIQVILKNIFNDFFNLLQLFVISLDNLGNCMTCLYCPFIP